jgi:hypothetical protein
MTPDNFERLQEAENQSRDLGSQVRAFTDTQSPTCILLRWFGFDVRKASSGLIGLSNTVNTCGKTRAFHKQAINEALKFPRRTADSDDGRLEFQEVRKTLNLKSARQPPPDCEAHLELRSDGQQVQSGVIECASNNAVGLRALYEVLDIFERGRAILLHGDGNASGLERAIENARTRKLLL